jgi:hypothetical protein
MKKNLPKSNLPQVGGPSKLKPAIKKAKPKNLEGALVNNKHVAKDAAAKVYRGK